MEPQRKRGVCLSSSPVFSRPSESHSSSRGQADSGGASAKAPLPRTQSTASRRNQANGELVTFKGKRNSNSNLGQVRSHSLQSKVMVQEQQQQQQRSSSQNSSFCCPCCPCDQMAAGSEQDAGEGSQSQARGGQVESNWKKSGDIFQTVCLDDPPRPAPRVLPVSIEPVNPYEKAAAIKKASARDAELVPPFKFAGLLGTIASSFLFSVGVFCVKLMPIENELPEKAKIIMFRGVSLMVLCGVTILCQQSTFIVRRDEILIMVLRSICGFLGACSLYVAIQYITLSEAVSLTYTSPLWTCLLGYFILGERLPITLIVGLPIGAIGLILIAHPDLILNVQDEIVEELQRHNHHVVVPPNYTLHHLNYSLIGTFDGAHNLTMTLPSVLVNASADLAANISQLPLELLDPEDTTELYLEHRWPGVLLSTASALIIAFVTILLKFRKTTPIQTTTFYLGMANFILPIIMQCFIGFGAWPSTMLEWCLHVVIGVCSFGGQALLQWSLMYETAGTLSVVKSVDIVFSFVWSSVFLGEDVLWTSVAGALCIGLVIALIMFNDSIQRGLSKACCKTK